MSSGLAGLGAVGAVGPVGAVGAVGELLELVGGANVSGTVLSSDLTASSSLTV